jgi:uncharacterized glyoxalase superfamily protein PhnB
MTGAPGASAVEGDVSPLPRVVPMLSYEDVAGMAEWLGRAFGFRETVRLTDPDGSASHVEMEYEGGVIMLGRPGTSYRNPVHHREACEMAQEMARVPWVIEGVHVSVDDVDAHCERARGAGAVILREPETQPYGRLYNAEDPEGHRWMFDQAAP